MGSDPKELFPIDVFLSEVKKFGKYAGFVGAILCVATTPDAEKLPDRDDCIFDAIKDLFHSLEVRQAIDAKVFDLYSDLALYGYI